MSLGRGNLQIKKFRSLNSVQLKNESSFLALDKNLKSGAVIGPDRKLQNRPRLPP